MLSDPCPSVARLDRLWPTWMRGRPGPGLFRQAGRLPGDHLPATASVGVNIGKPDAKAIGSAAGHDADAAGSSQYDRVAKVLRLDIGRLYRGVDRGAGVHVADQT